MLHHTLHIREDFAEGIPSEQKNKIMQTDKKVERETIIKVLHHCLNQGTYVKFDKVRFWFSNNQPTNEEFEKRLRKEIEEKIKLYEGVPDDSQTYRIIYIHAKLSLRSLQDKGNFNVDCAELINIFLELEPIFVNKLKVVGSKVIEDSFNKVTEEIKEEIKLQPVSSVEVVLEEGVTGKDMIKNKQKAEEFQETLSIVQDLDLGEEPSWEQANELEL